MTCPDCLGTGMNTVDIRTLSDPRPVWAPIPCEYCGGWGHVDEDRELG